MTMQKAAPGFRATSMPVSNFQTSHPESETKQHADDISISNVTTREKEILLNLSEGLSSKEIGKILFISQHTVETHKRNVMYKLKARNTVHLAVMAERMGLLEGNHSPS